MERKQKGFEDSHENPLICPPTWVFNLSLSICRCTLLLGKAMVASTLQTVKGEGNFHL